MNRNTDSLLREKSSLFTELVLDLGCSDDWNMSEDETKEQLNKAFSHELKEVFDQNNINQLIHRFWVWHEDSHADEMKAYQTEFRSFVRSLGIKLSEFDSVIHKCTPSRYEANDLLIFLETYYLLAQGKAPRYLIDHTYGMILERVFNLLSEEYHQMLEGISSFSKGALEGYPFVNESPTIPSFKTVSSTGFIPFLICRAKRPVNKMAAILYTPYIGCHDIPERWLCYLFSLKGDEVLQILRRILDALLDITIGAAKQPSVRK